MAEIEILHVLLYDKLIGTLTRLPGDKNLFAFSQEYIEMQNRPILSLSFKDRFGNLITDAKWTQTRIPPFFANLLPEGYMREYLAERAGVNPEREFFLLSALGHDLPGAIKVYPAADMLVSKTKRIQKEAKEPPLQFSLTGIQLKFSAIKTKDQRLTIPVDGVGGSWIIKLPSYTHRGVPENEYSMMELARRIGIDVPETTLTPVEQIKGLPKDFEFIGKYAFAIKRFDRKENGESVHIEDFAQIFNVYPEKKYRAASYRNLAEVIWLETGEEGIVEWTRRFVFNVLIGNGDMHLKNWSLIYPDRQIAKLAPAYDFVSTIPYLPNESLALNFVDSKAFHHVTFQQFERFAIKANLPIDLVMTTVHQTIDSFAKAFESTSTIPLEAELRKVILAHLATLPLWKKFS